MRLIDMEGDNMIGAAEVAQWFERNCAFEDFSRESRASVYRAFSQSVAGKDSLGYALTRHRFTRLVRAALGDRVTLAKSGSVRYYAGVRLLSAPSDIQI